MREIKETRKKEEIKQPVEEDLPAVRKRSWLESLIKNWSAHW